MLLLVLVIYIYIYVCICIVCFGRFLSKSWGLSGMSNSEFDVKTPGVVCVLMQITPALGGGGVEALQGLP